MLKKFFSTLALTSLLVGGLSVSQAYAEAPTVDISKVQNPGASFTVDLGDQTSFVVPSGLKSVQVTKEFSFEESFLLDRQSQVLGYKVTLTQPNGSAVTQGSPGVSFFKDVSGGLFSTVGGPSSQVDYVTGTVTVPADATDYYGRLQPRLYIESTSGALPAGTYNISIELTSFGGVEVVPADATGLTVGNLEYQYFVPGATFTIPDSVLNSSASGTLCLDTTKVAVGDTVTGELLVDGVQAMALNNFWGTKSGFKQYGDPGYRDSYSSSITVTQYDLDWGVDLNLNSGIQSLTAGEPHELSFKLYNQNDVDVSSDCAPAKPAAPTATFANGNVSVSGQFAVGSSAMYMSNGPECAVYDAAAPTVLVRSATVQINYANRTNYTCSFVGLSSGKTYLIKFRDKYENVYSEYSEAAQVVIPAAGYTVTSTFAGIVEAKKIVKVSSDVLPIEDLSSRTFNIADGKGGFYLVGANQGTCNPNCGSSLIRVRHATPTSLDATFAGTGALLIDGFTSSNSFYGGMGYYGAAKDKLAVAVNGMNFSTMSAESQIFFGSVASASTTSQTLSQASVNTLCGSAADGYATRPASNMQIAVVGAPTEEALLSITCQKQFTIGAGPQTTYLGLQVLATINSDTGALTYVARMATPDGLFNNASTAYSVNPNATGSEALITAFVTTSEITQLNNPPMANGGTILGHTVVRLDSNLDVISTTSDAWGTSGGTIANEPTMAFPAENTGKVFAIRTAGLNRDVVTFDGAAAGVSLSVDTTASEITTPSIGVLAGHAVPSNATVLSVSVGSIGKDAAGWVDLTTGVLTTGEVLTYTTATGNGLAKFWARGSDKNPYLIFSDAAAAANLTVLKWMDPSYVPPVGAVPAVTSKDVKYSKNTPAAGAKVTLTGTDLDSVISAKIGENAATLGTKTATSLQLTIPTASAAGTVDITLTTADGDTVVDTFTYVGLGVAQTVTVAALASSVTVGDADLALSATVEFSPVDAGTAGAITWSSETPAVCSIVANKARLLTAGTCTVKATAAASGVLLSGTDTESTTVSAAPVVAAPQTVTLTGPSKVVVDLDGFSVVSSASSGLAVVYSTTTPSVCTVSSTGYVVAKAEGTCSITSTQAGNANWLAASKTLSITVAKTPSTPVTEKGDIKKPLVLSKTGTFLKSGDTQLGWNRSKGTLALKLSVVYIGPVKATASFKVGSKTYTCTVKFGLLKKQSAAKMLTLTAPNLCAAKTEKTQLAALKKITTSTVVTITVVRDMYLPTTYKKVRTKTRILYAKLG